MTVTSGRHAQKDKERQQRIESGIRWGLKEGDVGLYGTGILFEEPNVLKRPRGDTNGVVMMMMMMMR